MKKFALYTLAFIFILASCKKKVETEVCTSNCKQIEIFGRIKNAFINTGIPTFDYQLELRTFRGNPTPFPGPTYPLKIIYQGKTTNEGYYHIKTFVDSTLFNDYSLRLKTNEIEGYTSFNAQYLEQSNYEGIDSFNINYYPNTQLKVNLKKTMTRNYHYLDLIYNWEVKEINYNFSPHWLFPYKTNTGLRDTSITLVVPIENKVWLTLQKTDTTIGIILPEILDSITIKKGINNEITIPY